MVFLPVLAAQAGAPDTATASSPAPSAAPAPAVSSSQPAANSGAAESTPANPFAPVQSQSLGEVDADLVGLLDQTTGGLPSGMWNGTDRPVVETLLPLLPAAVTSPAETDLTRRLLLSRAQPPQGATRGVSITAARLDRLLAIGEIGSVEPLAQQAPDQLDTPAVLAVRVDALLFQGEDKEACALAEHARGRTGDANWTERLAFCSALAGRDAEARLGVDVLGATGVVDPAFSGLIGKWVDKAKLRTLHIEAPTAVHFALLRTTGSAIDDATLESAPTGFLMAWADDEKAPLGQRIIAAELAASSGLYDAQKLAALYGQVKFKAALLKQPFDGTMPGGYEGVAYAVQRLALASDPVERGSLIAAAIESAKARGVLPAVALVMKTDLDSIEPGPHLADVAATLGFAELMAGEGPGALRWFEFLHAQGRDHIEPAQALRSIIAIHGDSTDLAWTPDDFVNRIANTDAAGKSRAALEWSLFRALGAPPSNMIWLATLQAPGSIDLPSFSPAVEQGLDAAATKGRVAETVLFSICALGSGGPRTAHPSTVAGVVQALSQVGMGNDARAIATEALAWQMP